VVADTTAAVAEVTVIETKVAAPAVATIVVAVEAMAIGTKAVADTIEVVVEVMATGIKVAVMEIETKAEVATATETKVAITDQPVMTTLTTEVDQLIPIGTITSQKDPESMTTTTTERKLKNQETITKINC
jgi:hypothetical protein